MSRKRQSRKPRRGKSWRRDEWQAKFRGLWPRLGEWRGVSLGVACYEGHRLFRWSHGAFAVEICGYWMAELDEHDLWEDYLLAMERGDREAVLGLVDRYRESEHWRGCEVAAPVVGYNFVS